MNYLGEHPLIGELGRASVTLSFVAAFLAVIAYIGFGRTEDVSWKKLARGAFVAHAAGVLGIVVSLFIIIFNHYFEYDYAWKHSSKALPMRYILSSFWEGQEGSFLLWMFWHAVLGLILIPTSKKWEAPVMGIVAAVQVFLASMILGVYLGDLKIGSSPFVLIRELPENLGLPWTTNPAYLDLIPAFQDGRGLNPLLQNYWMTIHPPTLFLGFASTLVPFAFALGALMKNDHKSWIKPALPWTFFSVGILGLGILMGGAWAYEALSFGGFWAWDPVENSSLVPWLTLVGAAHLMLVQKNKGGALRSLYFLALITFLLVLYSTFLTRSGVLGDSSVHAFVDLGLNGQLLVYLLFFVALAKLYYIKRFKSMAEAHQDDAIWSREFWMFIGSLVLLLAAFQIIFTTSIPVLNKLFGPEGWIALMDADKAPPLDAIQHYNAFQVPFAVVIALLMAVTQLMRYRGESFSRLIKKIWLSLALALVVSLALAWSFGLFDNPVYFALLFTSTWTVLGNTDYWIRLTKGSWTVAGPSIAHLGFGLLLLGALISNARKNTISTNKEYIAKDFPQNKNILLELEDTVAMPPYHVVWKGERMEGPYRKYAVEYYTGAKDQLKHAFTLEPTILTDKNMGNNAEPATHHTWGVDLYTHLTYADLEPKQVDAQGYVMKAEVKMGQRDTAIYGNYFVILDSLGVLPVQDASGSMQSLDLKGYLTLISITGEREQIQPVYSLRGNTVTTELAVSEKFGLKMELADVITEENKILFKAWDKQDNEKPFIVMQATLFPMINLLWIGCILMVIGTAVAVWNRIKRA